MRRSGHSSSALAIPERTRSFASWQALSGRPTIANAGTPRWRCASTSIGLASRPTRAWVVARASTPSTVGGRCARFAHGPRRLRHGSVPTSSRENPIVHTETVGRGAVRAALTLLSARPATRRRGRRSSRSRSEWTSAGRTPGARPTAASTCSTRAPPAARRSGSTSTGSPIRPRPRRRRPPRSASARSSGRGRRPPRARSRRRRDRAGRRATPWSRDGSAEPSPA